MSTTKDRGGEGADDRRDSPRIPITLQVRDGAGEFREAEGDLSVGGAFFVVEQSPGSNRIDLRFALPGAPQAIQTAAEILHIGGYDGKFGVHVKFTGLEARDELAVARFIDDHLLKLP